MVSTSPVVPRIRMLPLIHDAARWNSSAHLCCRAFLYFRAPVLPRPCQCLRAFVCSRPPWCRAPVCSRSPMVPRAAERYVVLACVAAHLQWCRLVLRVAALRSFVVAQFSILPRTVACGRAALHAAAHPWCRARKYASLSTCGRALIHVAAQFYVILFVTVSFTSLFAMVPRTVNASAPPCFRGLSRCMVPRI